MSFAYELQPGDVVVVRPGDVRTVHHVTSVGTSADPLIGITWSDARHSLSAPYHDFHLLHPTAPPIPAPTFEDPTSTTTGD